jgi:hypothetical protein
LKCLEKGQSEHEIVETFEGDKQLVALWINFLEHNHWMEKPDGYDGHWNITDKGKNGSQNMNQIPEVCAELAIYRIIIRIDDILKFYTCDHALAEIEAGLLKLLQNFQASETLTSKVKTDDRRSR